ncbi:MAG: hypothetical protein H6735_14055 [Alphaproteobacteria bacterium]|nr:hypothetical protein [Alphaproteobacteria bacterium]
MDSLVRWLGQGRLGEVHLGLPLHVFCAIHAEALPSPKERRRAVLLLHEGVELLFDPPQAARATRLTGAATVLGRVGRDLAAEGMADQAREVERLVEEVRAERDRLLDEPAPLVRFSWRPGRPTPASLGAEAEALWRMDHDAVRALLERAGTAIVDAGPAALRARGPHTEVVVTFDDGRADRLWIAWPETAPWSLRFLESPG